MYIRTASQRVYMTSRACPPAPGSRCRILETISSLTPMDSPLLRPLCLHYHLRTSPLDSTVHAQRAFQPHQNNLSNRNTDDSSVIERRMENARILCLGKREKRVESPGTRNGDVSKGLSDGLLNLYVLIQDRKWKNGVIGISSVAAVAFVCLVTYLSIKYLHKLKQREKTKVNSYESKGSASNKSSLDEEPVYEEVDSEQGTLNRKNDQVIYERMTSGSKTRAKQAVLDEDVEMTKTQKMSPYADGQSDSNYSNQIKNEIIEKETKTKKLGIKVSRHETRYTNK
ncbi:hypothetical protein EVAR_35548_1 [Eumeta japonica]|uniref:Uncharacterized protein n=1 Tax=Eumeta variegata TaxID=151549 RepID=A0A4C1X8T8_EUMVA|nr:hypothetical protein EVAR_35548_1 [Eumeta japonica]